MKIGYLGTGTWGFSLASLLSGKKHQVVSWAIDAELADQLNKTKEHPLLLGNPVHGEIHFTTILEEALENIDLLVESVTSAGLRPVLKQVAALGIPECPLVITSKGIEQGTGLVLPDVAVEVFGESFQKQVGVLSGPSFAKEVVQGLPTSVVGSAYDTDVMLHICEAFTTDSFRVYPNPDVHGVAYGGALKNIIAIACGITEGLALGQSAKASLMTRGLHEIRKLAVAHGCQAETLNGLAGMGDLCLTCSSPMSRNYLFGTLIAQGLGVEEARKKIGMVVEGAYTCISALQLSRQLDIDMPITEMVHRIVYENMQPIDAVKMLMQREIKYEYL